MAEESSRDLATVDAITRWRGKNHSFTGERESLKAWLCILFLLIIGSIFDQGKNWQIVIFFGPKIPVNKYSKKVITQICSLKKIFETRIISILNCKRFWALGTTYYWCESRTFENLFSLGMGGLHKYQSEYVCEIFRGWHSRHKSHLDRQLKMERVRFKTSWQID